METTRGNNILKYRQKTIDNAGLEAIIFANLIEKQAIDIIISIS
ncbi:MAG: hypothetical protein ACTS73_01705 [Arsenophonus sp. NEOnobi-MAG3]